MLQDAMARDALRMVASGTRMYLRKQSLDQRPMSCMRYLGQPIAAAVDAAPMRKEWEEILTSPLVVSLRMLLRSLRVRKVPL